MKVYVVHIDTYLYKHGVAYDLCCNNMGIYRTREAAEAAAVKYIDSFTDVRVVEVELDTEFEF